MGFLGHVDMNNIILRIRWILGIYDKTGIRPLTFEAFKNVEEVNKVKGKL